VGFSDSEPGILYEADALLDAEVPTSLKVINHNIKYGGARLRFFWECEGERYSMTEDEVTGHLDAIVEFINWSDPDVLILQEVDRMALRSGYIDQVQYILDRTNLNYGVYASQHKADFLPTDGMGYIDFGNATLSRWPISNSERIALPLVDDYPGYYQYFYLKRHILRAQIDIPGQEDFWVVNTHLEAFSTDGTKKEQIDIVEGTLQAMSDEGKTWLIGGDFNALPSGSETLLGFADACAGMFEEDTYEGEEDWLDSLFANFNSAMDLEEYGADNAPWFSYTGDVDVGWNRTLDYVFTNGTWTDPSQNYVMQSVEQGGYETLPISDHAPLHVFLELP
jgi:endonuclease/exonuclease/phosphatase family metal-dependent hydrolase